MFLIAIALLGLIAFGLGWALLGNMAGTLLVTFAWFGSEFDRFLTGLVIVGPALGAVCMVAAIWFSLRASGRCRTRREMLRAGPRSRSPSSSASAGRRGRRTPSAWSSTRRSTTSPTRMSPSSCGSRPGRGFRRTRMASS